MTDYINKKVNFFHSKISVKINKKIYSNGLSKVYICSDNNNSSVSYCLKIAQARSDDKALCNSINTEILILLSLKQTPNIVQMIDYYSEEKNNCTTYFILMEYCGNGTLIETMQKLQNEKNSFSEPQIWKIIHQIALGLRSVHGNKYAHRDLKPENILITLDGQYKISDFGSATSKFYETITNNIRNEIVFDISRNTTPQYRAPEQLDLYTGYPINEKVDIWALGVMLYNLLFDAQLYAESSKVHQFKGNLILTDEMAQACNVQLIGLLKNMMNPNPRERISAADIVFFIEKNGEKISNEYNNKLINIKKRTYSLAKRMSDATAKIFKRHSTQFWVLKLTNETLDTFPKHKYIKQIVTKAWTKKQKITKLYTCISTRPIHYLSSVALKSLYVLHSYIFYGPYETIAPNNFDLEDYILYFGNLWNARYSNDNYDGDDLLKNAHIGKFIVTYIEYIKAKMAYQKKYTYIDNNYSIENLNSTNFDFTLLTEKKFITDTLSLYSLIYQKFIQIPVIVNIIGNSLDVILQLFNEEIISLFNFIFYLLVAYKNYHSSEKNENTLKVFDSQFIELTNKAKEYLDKFKKFRGSIKSKFVFLEFPKNYIEYLNNLDNSLKFFANDFNLRGFFIQNVNKEIHPGIKLNRNMGKLIESGLFGGVSITNDNNNTINFDSFSIQSSEVSQKNIDRTGNNSIHKRNLSKGFEFSEEKFENSKQTFDFDTNKEPVKRNSTPDTRRIYSSKNMNMNNNQLSNNNNIQLVRNGSRNINDYYQNNINKIIENESNDISIFDNICIMPKIRNVSNPRQQNNNNNNTSINNISDNKKSTLNNKQQEIISNNSLFNVNYFSRSNATQSVTPIPNKNQEDNKIDKENYMTAFSKVDIQGNSSSKENSNESRVIDLLNGIFESGNIGTIPNENNINNNYNNAGNIYDSFMVQKQLNEMDNAFNNYSNRVINPTTNSNMGMNINRQQSINTSSNLGQNQNSQVNINMPNQGINKTNDLYESLYPNNSFHLNTNQSNNNYGNSFVNNNNTNYMGNNTNSNYPFTNNNINPVSNVNMGMYYYQQPNNYINNNNNNIPYNNTNVNPNLIYQNTGINNNNNILIPNNNVQQQNYNNNNIDNTPNNNNNLQQNINQIKLDNNNVNNTIPITNDTINNNIQQNNQDVPLDNGRDEDNFMSVNSQYKSNINIINIQNHYNSYTMEGKNIERLANQFLKEELSKGNLHWLIKSKDINLGKQIGFGGSSEVYIGDYRGTEVAVKKLRILEVKEENLKEFKREVSSLIMLRHPNLVLFMGAIAEKDNICIVTEYCAGGTLFNILHQKRELIITWELRVRILLEMAIGMNFLHTNSPPIIHRDLKSLNILLTEKIERPTDNTKIKISDFGLSKIIKQFDSGRGLMTGQLGTCHWMAPEVIENKQYTLKCDVFSYGIIIWETCTRKTPYGDMTQQQISFYVTIKKGRPDKSIIPQNTPPALIKLMEMCWDAEPNNRPSFEEIIDYLKKIKL